MSNTLIRIVSGICLLLATSCLRAQTELPKLRIQLDTLANGLQVVYQPDLSTDEVAVEFWMKAGVAHEPSGLYGLAHYYEHVTPYGLVTKPDRRSLFDSLRTGSNAQTLKDFTRYYLKNKPAGLAVTLEYVADRIAAPSAAISERKVEYERKRVFREIDRQAKHPFWSIEGSTVLDVAAFGPDHPYGHGPYGTLKNNQHFEVSDFQVWHDRYLRPNNGILFIVGNVGVAEARILVERYFSPIPKGPVQAPEAIPDTDHSQRILDVQTQTKAPAHYRALVWPLPEYGHPDHPALLLSAYLLDNRLKQVAPDGWSIPGDSAPGVLHRIYRKGGQMVAYLPYVENSRGKRVSRQLEQVVRELLAEGFTAAELATAKDQAADDIQQKLARLGFQSSRTELIGQGLLFAGDPEFYRKEWQQVQAASREDVVQTMQYWLKNDAAAVTILGNLQTNEEKKNK